jgi:hypothetical protein
MFDVRFDGHGADFVLHIGSSCGPSLAGDRLFPEMPARSQWPSRAAALALLLTTCSRTIEEEEPRELVDHRIEPCRKWCEPMLSPECGLRPEEVYGRTVEGCVEDCAAAEPGGWDWGRQADGTDSCAAEWFVMADCMDALTCDEQRSFFQRDFGVTDYPCKEEIHAQKHCYESTRSLDNPDGGR